ncbi:unnamed protein product [Amoebophrya sp. A25]|nr:unnamed protein product [Amoebophrya sp. A25]|eukprot:GSA25T00026822001.1
MVNGEEVEIIDADSARTTDGGEHGAFGLSKDGLENNGNQGHDEEIVINSDPVFDFRVGITGKRKKNKTNTEQQAGILDTTCDQHRWEFRVTYENENDTEMKYSRTTQQVQPLGKAFSIARIGVVEARRRAMLELEYWTQKLQLLHTCGLPLTRHNVGQMLATQATNISYAQAKLQLVRSLKFATANLLAQAAGGRSYCLWPLPGFGREANASSQLGSGASAVSKARGLAPSGNKYGDKYGGGGGKYGGKKGGGKNKGGGFGGGFGGASQGDTCELRVPQHPFQLHWTLTARSGGNPSNAASNNAVMGNPFDSSSSSQGIVQAAGWRNPVGFVVNAPSSRTVKQMREGSLMGASPHLQQQLLAKYERVGVYSAVYRTEGKTSLEGLTVLPAGSTLLLLAFLRPQQMVLKSQTSSGTGVMNTTGASSSEINNALATSTSSSDNNSDGAVRVLIDLDQRKMLYIHLPMANGGRNHFVNLPLSRLEKVNALRRALSRVFLQKRISDQTDVLRSLGTLFDDDNSNSTDLDLPTTATGATGTGASVADPSSVSGASRGDLNEEEEEQFFMGQVWVELTEDVSGRSHDEEKARSSTKNESATSTSKKSRGTTTSNQNSNAKSGSSSSNSGAGQGGSSLKAGNKKIDSGGHASGSFFSFSSSSFVSWSDAVPASSGDAAAEPGDKDGEQQAGEIEELGHKLQNSVDNNIDGTTTCKKSLTNPVLGSDDDASSPDVLFPRLSLLERVEQIIEEKSRYKRECEAADVKVRSLARKFHARESGPLARLDDQVALLAELHRSTRARFEFFRTRNQSFGGKMEDQSLAKDITEIPAKARELEQRGVDYYNEATQLRDELFALSERHVSSSSAAGTTSTSGTGANEVDSQLAGDCMNAAASSAISATSGNGTTGEVPTSNFPGRTQLLKKMRLCRKEITEALRSRGAIAIERLAALVRQSDEMVNEYWALTMGVIV